MTFKELIALLSLLQKTQQQCDYVAKSNTGSTEMWDPLENAYRKLLHNIKTRI